MPNEYIAGSEIFLRSLIFTQTTKFKTTGKGKKYANLIRET